MDNFNMNTLQCSLPHHGSYQNKLIEPYIVYCKKKTVGYRQNKNRHGRPLLQTIPNVNH